MSDSNSAAGVPTRWGLLPVVISLALGSGAAVVVPSEYGRDPRPTKQLRCLFRRNHTTWRAWRGCT